MAILKAIGYLGLIGFITIAFRSNESMVIPWFIAFSLIVGACLNLIEGKLPW